MKLLSRLFSVIIALIFVGYCYVSFVIIDYTNINKIVNGVRIKYTIDKLDLHYPMSYRFPNLYRRIDRKDSDITFVDNLYIISQFVKNYYFSYFSRREYKQYRNVLKLLSLEYS